MNECNIAKDLMALCAEDLASADSKEFVEKHISSCEACRNVWSRYREELPSLEEAKHMAEKYQKGMRKDALKIVLMTLGSCLLTVAIAAAIFLYCGWEKGEFAKGTRYTSPDGLRSIELADLEGAGFFGNEGSILKFRYDPGWVNRYPSEWQELQVYWAPDSETSLLVYQNSAGETEMRIVDQKGGLPDGGTYDIPGLFPKEEEPDLLWVLTELCAEQGIEASCFTFVEWEEDSLHLRFLYETADGSGLLTYAIETGKITLSE